MRAISSFDDARIVITQLSDRLERLETKDINFKRRRITNASPSIDSHDYVIQAEIEDLVKSFLKAVNTQFDPGEELVLRGLRPRVRLIKSGTTAQSRVGQFTTDGAFLTFNISYDGTNWNLDDTGIQGVIVKLPSATNLLEVYLAQSGANPRTIYSALTLGNLGGLTVKDLTVFDDIGATGGNNTTTVIHKAGSSQGTSPVIDIQNNGGTSVVSVLKDGELKCVSGAVNATPPAAATRPGEFVVNTWLGIGTGTRTAGYAADISGKVKITSDLNLSGLTVSRNLSLDASGIAQTLAPSASITDVSGTAGVVYTATEQTMINDLKTAVNSALAALRTHKIIS